MPSFFFKMSGKYAKIDLRARTAKRVLNIESDKYWKWNKKTETPYWCRCFFNNILTVLHKKAHLTVCVKKQLFEFTGKCNQQTQTSQKWFPEVSKIPEHWHTGGAKMRMANDGRLNYLNAPESAINKHKLLRSDSREVSKIPEHWHTGGAKMRMANDD